MVPFLWVLSIGVPNFKYVGEILSEVSWFKKYGDKISFSNFQTQRLVIYSLGKL